jgi:hypothetical protein
MSEALRPGESSPRSTDTQAEFLRLERRRRIFTALAALFVTAGVLTLFIREIFGGYFLEFALIGATLVLVGVGLGVSTYLTGDPRGEIILGGEFRSPAIHWGSSVDELDKANKVQVHDITSENPYGNTERGVLRSAVERLFENTRNRLGSEILNLRRQARTNLLLGIATTAIAVLILAGLAFYTDMKMEQPYWLSALKTYLPRVTLAIFIQVFGFFFLRLYRAGLADIKYYQNELTNVESLTIALSAALALEDAEVAEAVLTRLSMIERNFILKVGESTVELEHLRQENEGMKLMLSSLGAAFTGQAAQGGKKV